MWIEFYDMHSGGTQKAKWDIICIEADSEKEAVDIFEEIFGHNPLKVTCECCGEDYIVTEVDKPLSETLDKSDLLIIYKEDI